MASDKELKDAGNAGEEKQPKGGKDTQRKGPKMEAIVRIAETNLDGTKPVHIGIRKVKGISFMMSNAVGKASGLGAKIIADLTEEEQKRLEDVITNPQNYGIPSWMYNRKNDPASGKDMHISVSNMDFTNRMDINELKKIRCYRGIRHASGLPCRGQRTKGSFRKGKIVGVVKKKAQQGKK